MHESPGGEFHSARCQSKELVVQLAHACREGTPLARLKSGTWQAAPQASIQSFYAGGETFSHPCSRPEPSDPSVLRQFLAFFEQADVMPLRHANLVVASLQASTMELPPSLPRW